MFQGWVSEVRGNLSFRMTPGAVNTRGRKGVQCSLWENCHLVKFLSTHTVSALPYFNWSCFICLNHYIGKNRTLGALCRCSVKLFALLPKDIKLLVTALISTTHEKCMFEQGVYY